MLYDHKAVLQDAKMRGQLEDFSGDEFAAMLTSGHIDANKFDSINFVGEEVNYEDIIKSANMDLMASSGVYSAMRIAGSTLIAAAPGLGKLVGAAAYMGAEGFSLASSMLRSRDSSEFWEDYYHKISEVSNGNGFLKRATQGVVEGGNLFMGGAVDKRVDHIKNSWAFIGGNMLGYLGRDVTMGILGTNLATALSPKLARLRSLKTIAEAGGDAANVRALVRVKDVQQNMERAADMGFKVAMVGGSAMANALNKYSTERGNGSDTVTAVRNSFAIGAATAISGAASFAFVDKMFAKLIPKYMTPEFGRPLQFGTEMGGWAAAEDYMETTIKRGMGDSTAEMQIGLGTSAAMFAAGFLGGRFAGSLGRFAKGAISKRFGSEAIEAAEKGIKEFTEGKFSEGFDQIEYKEAKQLGYRGEKKTRSYMVTEGIDQLEYEQPKRLGYEGEKKTRSYMVTEGVDQIGYDQPKRLEYNRAVNDAANAFVLSNNILEGDANAVSRDAFNSIIQNRSSNILGAMSDEALGHGKMLKMIKEKTTGHRDAVARDVDDFIRDEGLDVNKIYRESLIDGEMDIFQGQLVKKMQARKNIIKDTALTYDRLWKNRNIDHDFAMKSPLSKEDEGILKDIIMRVMHQGEMDTVEIANEVFSRIHESFRYPDNIAIIMKEIHNQRGLL